MSVKDATVTAVPECPKIGIEYLRELCNVYRLCACGKRPPKMPRFVMSVPGDQKWTFNQPLMILLETYIKACKSCLGTRTEPWQGFSAQSFQKWFCFLLKSKHQHCWSYDHHILFRINCKRLIGLCVTKMKDESFCQLEILALVLDPDCEFHSYNSERVSKSVSPNSRKPVPDEALFAGPPNTEKPYGWLVDLINAFGTLGGFDLLLERFQNVQGLTVITMYSHIKPFDQCRAMLTDHTMEAYMLPILEMVSHHLENLSNEEVMEGRHTMMSLDMFSLNMTLRLLQISSASGKTKALNMMSKIIDKMEGYWHSRDVDDDEWLTADKMANWIKKNRVLQIILSDPLPQRQGIENLENVCRFTAERKALTLEDLDSVLAAQSAENNAVTESMHGLLEKLAGDLSPDQQDHLFDQLQALGVAGTASQQERLLELMRRLAEQGRVGSRVHRLRQLLGSPAPLDDVSKAADGAAAILCSWPSTSDDGSIWTEEEEVILIDQSQRPDSGASTAALDQKDQSAPDQEDRDSRQTPDSGKLAPTPLVADSEGVPSQLACIKRQIELQLREQHNTALRHMEEKHQMKLEHANLQIQKARHQAEQARLVSEVLRIQLERARAGTD